MIGPRITLTYLTSCLALQTALVAGLCVSKSHDSGPSAHAIGAHETGSLPPFQDQSSSPPLQEQPPAATATASDGHVTGHALFVHVEDHQAPGDEQSTAAPMQSAIAAAVHPMASISESQAAAIPSQVGGIESSVANDSPPTASVPSSAASDPPASTASTQASSSSGSTDQAAWQSGHDGVRSQHTASALGWRDDLYQSALTIAQKCQGFHDGTSGHGENLAWGGGVDAASSSSMWADEACGCLSQYEGRTELI